MYKHALATLADGIELLLKARLEQKDWHLVFADIDKATRQKYESGDFVSVSYDQAVKRLANLCDVQLHKDDMSLVKALRQNRNRVRHFAIDVSSEAATSNLAKGFAFALGFWCDHLEKDNEGGTEQLTGLTSLMSEWEEFVQARLRQLKDELVDSSGLGLFSCPICQQLAMQANKYGAKCLFCFVDIDGAGAASSWVDTHNPPWSLDDDAMNPSVVQCPWCSDTACVDVGNGFHCFSCNESGECDECSCCGELNSDSELDICSDCLEYKMSRED